MSEITSLTLYELIKNIKEKKISSNEAAKSFVDRAEKSKKINAYVTENFENCLKLSKEFDDKPNFVLGKNEVFGELGVLNNQLRTSNVKSMTKVELLKIKKSYAKNDFRK